MRKMIVHIDTSTGQRWCLDILLSPGNMFIAVGRVTTRPGKYFNHLSKIFVMTAETCRSWCCCQSCSHWFCDTHLCWHRSSSHCEISSEVCHARHVSLSRALSDTCSGPEDTRDQWRLCCKHCCCCCCCRWSRSILDKKTLKASAARNYCNLG